MAERLIAFVERDALLMDERGDAYAHVVCADHRELAQVRSRAFNNWLAGQLFDAEGKAANGEALGAAGNVIEAIARRGKQVKLWNRVARDTDGAIWIDLADPRWRAVRVTAAGWTIETNPPPLFRRFSHQQALPEPVSGGEVRKLLGFLNLASEADAVLFLASTVAALIPDIPQAIVILHGPQGSAKTTAGKMRRALVDPSAVPTLIVRRDVGELVQALDHHYLPLLDNLNTLSEWQAEILCQATTGGGFSKRRLHSDADDVIFSFLRPLVLTGINVPTAAPDLLDRAVLIGLERVPPQRRKEERDLWRDFDAVRPDIFGGLLDALSGAMRQHDRLAVDRPIRLADFSQWGAAAAEALGYGAHTFIDALHANVERQIQEVVEHDPVAHAILDFARERRDWTGSGSELFEALNNARGDKPQEHGWPKRAADLGRRLNVLSTTLAQIGVKVESGRVASQRRWRVAWQA